MKKKLKKAAWLCIVLFRFTGTASAQDIDSLVKKAVDGLVARYNTPITVSVKAPTIGATDSVSAFSGYLSRIIERSAVNNSLYRVTAPVRGAPPIRTGGGQRGQITGSYDLVGDQVEVTLTLIAEPDGNRVAATAFKMSRAELERLDLDVLPENRKTGAEVQAQAALFEDIPLSPPPAAQPLTQPPVWPTARPPAPATEAAPVNADSPADVSLQSDQPDQPESGLTAQIWPDKESRIYVAGDTMTISLYASRDCWFKVYHIDVNNQMQLIYPNQTDRNNTLKANTLRVIPNNTEFEIGEPYGEETILAVFSEAPFENLEKDMLYPVPATRESISRAADRRGLAVLNKAAGIPDRPTEKTRAARFSYTINRVSSTAETVR